MNIINNNVINVAILNSKILGENIIESYIPFVSTLISVKKYEKIDIEQICVDFYVKYTFKIPAMPMKEILMRMLRKKMIIRDKLGKLVPNYDKIFETNFETDYKEMLIKYENILDKFTVYAKDKFNIIIDKNMAEECFSKFIKEKYIETILNDENLKEIIDNNSTNEMFVLYKFVIEIYSKDYESFKVIQKFCMGYFVANALSLDNVSQSNTRFKNKKIFFDTNFILRLLGLDGEFNKSSYKAIIEILKENKCKLFIFSHTYDEIVNILETARLNLNKTNELSSDVQKYFWSNNYSKGDITLLIATLHNKLNKLGIYISKIEYSNTSDNNQIDEQSLYNEIINIYSKNKSFDEKSKSDMIWNDVKSMALIYRDINMNRSYSVQTLRDVFITTNQSLAYACKNYDKTLGKKENAIAPCMTDVFLGTILWLQNPIRYDKCNEKQILASCYSSVKLDNKSLNMFAIELNRLKEKDKITNDDYMLMKEYSLVEDLLSEKIMGNSDNIDEITTYEVVQEVKKNIIKGYEEKIINEKKLFIEIENQKINIEKKYKKLRKNITEKLKKEAKIRAIIVSLLKFIIIILPIILDLIFNIYDLIMSKLNIKMKMLRFIVYIILTFFSLISIFDFKKDYRESYKKLLKEKKEELSIFE